MNLLDHMRIFVFVAKFSSFTGAAKALNLTLPAVSRSISRLERHLNAALLTRTTRRLALTDVGQDFFYKCTKIIVGVDEAVQTASDTNVQPQGHLRVHAAHEIGRHQLMPLIADYRRDHPLVTFDLVLDDCPADQLRESADVSVSVLPMGGERWASRNIGATYSVMCASRAYLAQNPAPKVPEDLSLHECLNPLEAPSNAQDTWTFEGPYGPVNIYLPPSSFQLNARDAIVDAVRAGLGIGCIPAFMAAELLRDGEVVRVLPDYHLASCGIHAICAEHRVNDVCVRSWINYLSAHFPRRLAAGVHALPAHD
ncbi:LysR family transcriptional regulator [Pseudomonas sp. KU26590]|uniref:LysR family transcriptional regulator n=1 Tax=Pseudomonas sp. KU26590 TaxID=2991051 RepID=UPI00223DC9F9|nr:LysR family transcriptional regulator [Pseudomonas sp. KU26590]UZJ57884.1 LysR family transcriptional regulator [Pseudomonas sp. KU26590]